ncbi:MAG: ribonuclease HII [Coriobacteriales bacterium]|nr:ribonuclease HII [Coriobacteriales bacterium]
MADAGNLRAKEIVGLISGATSDEIEDLEKRYGDDARKQVRDALKRARTRLERERKERERVLGMYETQRELGGEGLVVGVDEVGRGAVAGPLTVAAVAVPAEPILWGINDSKQLTPARREALSQQIEDVAIAIGIAHIPPHEIDNIGMAQALRKAMRQAIEATQVEPDCVLIDGNPVHVHEKERCVVKGDARIASIACASIVAKVTRDALMVEYDKIYPAYHFRECKGYASAEHIAAIKREGLCEIHRASFCGNFLETMRLF